MSQRETKDKLEVKVDNPSITKAEAKPTYDDVRDYVMEMYGVKVSSLDIANAKNLYGVKERGNYNITKNKDYKKPNLTEEKKKMLKEALKHFKMI